MAYGSVLTDVVQSSVTGSPAVFKDGAGTETGTLCRAWVNFSGTTGTRAGSFNVSSVTRNSAGNYTVNFTNAMSDANYAVTLVGSASDPTAVREAATNDTYSTTSVTVYTSYVSSTGGSSVAIDTAKVSVSVFR